ncbi:LacI family DNA-binding transcriptional regulator [Caballeronia sp. LZ029]|uniref:LacI family DNA-binding transcriptional regulator n=1 Tax=Caballeronia sp. LZ029 TaxID=3038564 RepID=UPI002855ECD3|nr:LacI family DNA-binding transcriptional regulator [Caballeronia sp. LZ029]MDR5745888.1 LacI family DNA-binding transcriptional regulator [Caballeronia sp. LZ029]
MAASKSVDAAPTRRARSGAKGVRITDVAAIAGVSPITVSRVFNAPDTVAPETLARVRHAVAELGYVPNRLAGGLSSAKSRLIAAIVPTVAHSLFSETVQVFSDTMSRAGYQVLLGLSGYSDEDEAPLLDAVLSRRPEGVFLTGVAHTPTLRERLRKIGIPIVETWDMSDDPIDMLVGFSHYRIGVMVAERFLARGTRRPALVSANDQRALARRRGFVETLAKHGVNDVAEMLMPPPSSIALGKEGLRRVLEMRAGVDAIFCSSDLLALGVVSEARRLAIDIPGRIAVCGFGDLEFTADAIPALTTVRVDGKRIGATAARCLIDRLGGATDKTLVDVGFEMVERETL